MNKENIYSCPFCGSGEIHVCRTNKNACWIRCDNCGADAESSKTRKKAIKNWNRREPTNSYSNIVEDDDKDGCFYE